jgi:Zn-dependent membrane protease YugP
MLRSLSKLYLIVATAIVVSTIIPVLFLYRKFHEICICIPNILAYAWILFSVTVLFSIITILLKEKNASDDLSVTKTKIIWYLLMIQSACFMAGMISLVYFAARIMDVI